MQKKKSESKHRPYIFNKSLFKWIIDLNVKCKTIKLLEDDIGEILDDFGFGSDFRIDKLEFIKILKFCSAKDIRQENEKT